ncbi:hypothetical protein LZ31DRAFT_81153 [Colletotrichum somersetense]|nr:hypothetical protein LZ31DRAFT_81153 [Colletotrichum somersetense]
MMMSLLLLYSTPAYSCRGQIAPGVADFNDNDIDNLQSAKLSIATYIPCIRQLGSGVQLELFRAVKCPGALQRPGSIQQAVVD